MLCSVVDYAGLTQYQNKTISSNNEHTPSNQRLLSTGSDKRTPEVFPQRSPGPALTLLKELSSKARICLKGQPRLNLTSRDLIALGIAAVDNDRNLALIAPHVVDEQGNVIQTVLRELIEQIPGCKDALEELERNPATPSYKIGKIIKSAQGTSWSENWTTGAGKQMRAWARAAGVSTAST